MRRALALLTLTAMAAIAAMGAEKRPVPKPDPYTAEVHVRRVVVDARVVDDWGHPVTGLAAGDFVVEVDGKPVTDVVAEWTVDGHEPEIVAPAPQPPATTPADATPAAAPGRLILFVFERSLEWTRTPNLIKMSKLISGTLDRLQPTDRVAMLTYDSHLDLHADFTTDRARLREVIDRAAVSLVRPASVDAVPRPRLADAYDARAAKDAATPEEALIVIGRALKPIPGPKTMFFFAWGVGRHTSMGDGTGPKYEDARSALLASRTSVFTFDVTDADWHSLEGPLRILCDDTGGMYQKVNLFAENALVKAEAAIGGHYVLVFPAPALRPGHHDIRVRLRKGLRGDVLARTGYED